ncbi:hypothetical protein SAY86_024592 [Trapa natans]|uniref:Uncharacterized protein n=1 Tax=Trapa natans TaxID=22666 RepID=A0AAN7M6X6_TRANT|nr:hypothetical protein SAY86_024592 [Trapa natans]
MLSKEGELEAAQRSLQGRKPTKKSSKEQNLSLTLSLLIYFQYTDFLPVPQSRAPKTTRLGGLEFGTTLAVFNLLFHRFACFRSWFPFIDPKNLQMRVDASNVLEHSPKPQHPGNSILSHPRKFHQKLLREAKVGLNLSRI